MLQLTKNQKSTVDNIATLKTISIFYALFGLLGIFTGLYSYFFRVMSPDARPLIRILTGLSVGGLVISMLLFQAYSIIEKLKSKG